MYNIGRTILIMGILLVIAGTVLVLSGKMGLPFGELPGDITWQRKNITVFIPLGTMLMVSVVLSLILNLFSRWKR